MKEIEYLNQSFPDWCYEEELAETAEALFVKCTLTFKGAEREVTRSALLPVNEEERLYKLVRTFFLLEESGAGKEPGSGIACDNVSEIEMVGPLAMISNMGYRGTCKIGRKQYPVRIWFKKCPTASEIAKRWTGKGKIRVQYSLSFYNDEEQVLVEGGCFDE